jgi:outer membrane protein
MTSFRRVGALALVLSFACALPALAQSGPKIAYINSKELLEKAPGREAAEAQFNKEMDGFKTQVQQMGASIQTMIETYQKGMASMTAAQKEAKEKEIRTKQEEYQRKVQQLDQQAAQRQQELVQPILDQVRKVLDQIRVEDGYAFILDAGAEGGTIVAADRNLDITSKVLARLKPVTASAKPDSAKAPAGAKPAPAGITKKP